MLDFSLQLVGCKSINILGDGIVISTPLGSTGYNYSAGGNIMPFYITPQYMHLIKPINTYYPRSMREICYDGRDYVFLTINNTNYAKFMIDGQYIGIFTKLKIILDESITSTLIYSDLNFLRNKIFTEQT